MSALPRWRDALRRRRDPVWIALALALLAGVLAAGDWTWRMDRVIYDRALSWWTRPAPPDITIVAIDDASIAAIGRWPWPRTVHATLLERLAPARPLSVLLDMVLSEADPRPEHDALLARAMRQAAPVVLPVPWLSVNGRDLRWLEPQPTLAAAARLAAAESVPDADGVVRHVFLRVGERGAPRPHAALALLGAAGEVVHPRIRPEHSSDAGAGSDDWQRDGRLLLRYGGAPGHLRRVSYVDLLSGAVPAERLRGHHILIGMTAQGLGDALATPVNAQHRAMPGVEVIGQTLHMLRSGDGMRAVPRHALAVASALLVGLGVLLLARLGHRAALAAALGAVLVALLGSMAAMSIGVWATPVPLIAAGLLAYPLLSWRRLEQAVSGLDAEIHRFESEAVPARRPAEGADPIDARLHRLHAAAALLREARRFLADVLASLPNGMLVADGQGRVIVGNSEAAALFEVESGADIQGLDLARLLGEFDSPEVADWAALLAALRPGGDRPVLQARLAGQGDYVVHLAAAELAGERRILAAIADVAPVKRAERQREEALAFVSHDLRSPAASIALLADMGLAGADRLPPDLLGEVRRLAQRLITMSDEFVRYAQVDRMALDRHPVALSKLLERVAGDLGPQVDAAGMRLTVAPHDRSAAVEVDLELVARAVTNLVSNALRHSSRGAEVELCSAREPGALVIRVADHGAGLSPAQRAQLEAGDDGLRSTHRDGVGLGLRFVQRVARRHGGRLRVRAQDSGPGAVFELVLPDAVGGAVASVNP